LKALRRGFEIVSGLKIIFAKSNVIRISLDDRSLNVAADFVCCNIGTMPFKFLAIPIGANQRRVNLETGGGWNAK